MDNSGGDVTRRLYIGLTGGDGSLLTNSMDFVFDWPAEAVLSDFQWDARFVPALGWALDDSLPAPSISGHILSFLLPIIPTGPDPQLIVASVDLTVSASVALGNYSIAVGSFGYPSRPTVNDELYRGYDVDEGSGSILFSVTPEPSTMALLAFGAFVALRRRSMTG